MARIMVVDDDPHIREVVRHFLGASGFDVVEAPDGREALRLLERTRADLVVLDVMMPNMDGWQLCQELKRRRELPILMLTAKGETSQKLKGFELGTDDYLVKPFEPAELVARVKALLKRYHIEASQTVQIGGLVLSRKTYLIQAGEQSLTIPLKEFELLFKLGSSPGKTFTREQLIQAVWGSDFEGTDRTVDVHVNRLRERFPEARFGYRITAIRGLGYRLELTP
ncbi:response regulator transcription factor [Hyalangium gracile]|uniref:response regulator transcription factor n=1 Tax=Hyalangium gracile TaxID=394092 RepID=UPI001CCD95C9|nr:response regulator transcription factor [Hyalangium gracile]